MVLGVAADRAGKDFNTLDAAGNDWPAGLWSNGDRLYVVDAEDAKVYDYPLPSHAHCQPTGGV